MHVCPVCFNKGMDTNTTPTEQELDTLAAAVHALEDAAATLDPAAVKAWKLAKREYREAEALFIEANPTERCWKCGGSGNYLHYGTCFACWGSGQNSRGKRTFTDVVRGTKVQAQRDAEAEVKLAALPEDIRQIFAANAALDSDDRNPFIEDVARKAERYDLSDKQIEAVRKSAVRDAEFAARKAAEAARLAAAPALPEGRYEVEGKVLSHKQVESDYGTSTKMLVQMDDGNKVWGTVPQAIWDGLDNGEGYDDLDGSRIRFTAQVERSNDDEHFGFYKRPTKAEVVR